MTRRSYVLVVAAVFSLGVATRLLPLFWSSLPATLDGFAYARLAAETVATGGLPLEAMAADELIFALGLTLASLVTGTRPLHLAQPFSAVVGAVAPVTGVFLVRRLGTDSVDSRWLRVAAALSGFLLVFDGIFLRRTGAPDEELMGLVLVPLLAWTAHRWLTTQEHRWILLSSPLLVAFPLLHNFSSLHAVVAVTAVVALHAARSKWQFGMGLALGLGFWLHFFGYYRLAEYFGLHLTYTGLVRGHLGLLAAWVVLLVAGVLWIRTTSRGRQRLLYGLPIALWFAILLVNTVQPVFPGTVATRTEILLFVSGFVLFVLLGDVGFPSTVDHEHGPAVLALIAAPATIVCYTLTGTLTPDFWDAVLRSQTFVHTGIVVVACVGMLRTVEYDSRVGTAVVVVLLLGALLTLPLGYMNLDTGTYPSTTLQSEYDSVAFFNEHMTVSATTADTLTRVDSLSFPHAPALVEGPARAWLTTGVSPQCPVLMQASWETTGAHLYPLPPATVEQYDTWTATQDKIYTGSGIDPVSLYLPDGTSGCGR